jgi:subtilisin family serine protease
MKPAWSWQFEREVLGTPPALGLDVPPTREWAFGAATGAGVRVAVVDSGVEGDHPLVGGVQGSVALEYDAEAEGGYRLAEGPHDDLFGHGTACAGIIRSLAPRCEIHSVRVLGARLTGKGFIFAAGARWAIENGMDVVNLSLSTSRSEYYSWFHEIGDEAYFRRVMLIASVSNVRARSYPAEFSSVFSVACREGDDPREFDYNPDGPAEFGARGLDIEVPWKGGQTIRTTGNSYATAHLSGIVALLLSKHPGLTPFQVKTVLAAVASNARPG